MMRFALITILTFSFASHAQFGIGMSPGMQCPYPMGPASGAMNGGDEISNLQGQMYNTQTKLNERKSRLASIDARLSRAKSRMKKVLSSSAISAVEEHRQYSRDGIAYQENCSAPDRGASVGTSSSNVVRLPGQSEGNSYDREGMTPVPSAYCYEGNNYWVEFAADGGYVIDGICDYYMPPKGDQAPSDAARTDCMNGLEDFYAAFEAKVKLETEIAELDGTLSANNRRMEQIQDEISEGTYCAYCNNQRRGHSNMGTTDWLSMGVQVLSAFGSMYMNYQQRQQQQQMMRMGAPPMMPFPGPHAFPGNPYAAPMPGYMGMQNGMYGMGPGAIGQGGFGCQGTSPFGMNNPMGGQFNPFMNSQANPFANPYMQGMQNPMMNNPMFNPGYGPGIMPMLGNGAYNPYLMGMNGMNGMNPYLSGMNGMNPYLSGGQSGYFNNPYTFNPSAPYGNPYFNGSNGALGAPAMLPYLGGGANNPLAYSNYNLPYNNPWGAPHVLSPVQNFNSQMEVMRRQIQVIQNSPAYGGGAPAILPMPTPIYNQPGTPGNPLPSTTPSGTTQPLQIR